MRDDEQDKLDVQIDAALRDEPYRELPIGFRRSVDERVQMAVLLDLERGRFRRCWFSAGAFVALVALATTVGWVAGDVAAGLKRTVPGALGSYDQMMVLLASNWPAISLTSGAMAIVMGFVYFALSPTLSLTRSARGQG